MWVKLFVAAASALMTIAYATGGASAAHGGWYVIMGSFDFQDTVSAERRAREVYDGCGLDAIWEDAINIEGMNPNVLFVYLGPYHQKSQATAILQEARTCVDDAYIKEGAPK